MGCNLKLIWFYYIKWGNNQGMLSIAFAIHHRETRAEFAPENNMIVAEMNKLELSE